MQINCTYAQINADQDTVPVIQPGVDTTQIIQEVDSVVENKPLKAAFYSAILPGLGQIYNKKYWKLPILIGGAGTIGYFIDYNNKKLLQFRAALIEKRYFPDRILTNPLIEISEDNLERGIDYYRRNRDMLMITLVGIYLIQIVDAHVDAHLMDFDISEDLSLRLHPDYVPGQYLFTRHYGLKLTLNFN